MRRIFLNPSDERSYIVRDTDGSLHILDKEPASPATWEARRPYKGAPPLQGQELSTRILMPYLAKG